MSNVTVAGVLWSILLTSPLFAAYGGEVVTQPEARLPNIVLILADDLGWGDIRYYNPRSRIPTPNLDRLAEEGVAFRDAHSPSAVCTPTRYALLTGRYAWRTRLKSGVLWGYSPSLLQRGRPTIATLLRRAGYRTGVVGKWHLGLGEDRETDYSGELRPGPITFGFDEFFGIPASLDMEPYLYVRNDRVLEYPSQWIDASAMRREGGGGFWRAGPIAPHFRHEEVLPRLAQEAEAFLKGSSKEIPFFLYFALPAPHTPWMPLPPYRDRSRAGAYGDFCVQVDDVVGGILRTLEDMGAREDTLILFSSDNGAHWLPSDILRFGHRANGHWRGQKADIWEGGHRVPLIATYPRGWEGGRWSSHLVGLNDLYATVAELVERPLREGEAPDSCSFLRSLREPEAPAGRDELVHHSLDGTFAVRKGPWKLILGLGSGGFSNPQRVDPAEGGPSGQLYHLGEDPQEETNLFAGEPGLVRELTALLERIQDEEPAPSP